MPHAHVQRPGQHTTPRSSLQLREGELGGQAYLRQQPGRAPSVQDKLNRHLGCGRLEIPKHKNIVSPVIQKGAEPYNAIWHLQPKGAWFATCLPFARSGKLLRGQGVPGGLELPLTTSQVSQSHSRPLSCLAVSLLVCKLTHFPHPATNLSLTWLPKQPSTLSLAA